MRFVSPAEQLQLMRCPKLLRFSFCITFALFISSTSDFLSSYQYDSTRSVICQAVFTNFFYFYRENSSYNAGFCCSPCNQRRDSFYKIRTSNENSKDDDKSDDVVFNHFSRLFFIFVLLRNRKEYSHHDTPYARGR